MSYILGALRARLNFGAASLDPSRKSKKRPDWGNFGEPLLRFGYRIAGYPNGTSRWDESLSGKFVKPEEDVLLPALYQWVREENENLPHTGLRFEKLKPGAPSEPHCVSTEANSGFTDELDAKEANPAAWRRISLWDTVDRTPLLRVGHVIDGVNPDTGYRELLTRLKKPTTSGKTRRGGKKKTEPKEEPRDGEEPKVTKRKPKANAAAGKAGMFTLALSKGMS